MKRLNLSIPARLTLWAFALTVGLAAGTVAASYAFLGGTGLYGRVSPPATGLWPYMPTWVYSSVQFWNYAFLVPHDGWSAAAVTKAAQWLRNATGAGLAGGIIATALVFRVATAISGLPFIRPLRRAKSDVHGHADWMSMEDAIKMFPGPDPAHGGVVVGEAYRVDQDRVAHVPFSPRNKKTWGRGGKTRLLIDPCVDGQTHSLVFAGPGGFKSTAATTTLIHWTGSSVVFDPACELGPMLEEYKRASGHQVYMLDPERSLACGFNALDWIDIEDPMAQTNVDSVVSWIFGDDGNSKGGDNNKIFRQWARTLVKCLMAHMLWSPKIPQEQKTLLTVRRAIVTPEDEMKTLLQNIYEHSDSLWARDLAGTLKGITDETFSGLYANATEATAWLSVLPYANLVSGNTFRTADITGGKVTVFCQIPLNAVMTTPAIGRVIIGALMNAVYETGRQKEGKADVAPNGRVLFLLDEARQLGRMDILATARDALRKYGITMQLLFQSVGQLIEVWGPEGKRAWYDGVSWRGYAVVQDMDTAREVSAAAGEYGVEAVAESGTKGWQGKMGDFGSSSSSTALNRSDVKRELIKPTELTQDARTDEIFIVPRGGKVLRCGRAIYFRRNEINELVGENRFANRFGKKAA